MKAIIGKFLRDESGATAIEYALIAAGIGIAILSGVNALGTALKTKYTNITTSLNCVLEPGFNRSPPGV